MPPAKRSAVSGRRWITGRITAARSIWRQRSSSRSIARSAGRWAVEARAAALIAPTLVPTRIEGRSPRASSSAAEPRARPPRRPPALRRPRGPGRSGRCRSSAQFKRTTRRGPRPYPRDVSFGTLAVVVLAGLGGPLLGVLRTPLRAGRGRGDPGRHPRRAGCVGDRGPAPGHDLVPLGSGFRDADADGRDAPAAARPAARERARGGARCWRRWWPAGGPGGPAGGRDLRRRARGHLRGRARLGFGRGAAAGDPGERPRGNRGADGDGAGDDRRRAHDHLGPDRAAALAHLARGARDGARRRGRGALCGSRRCRCAGAPGWSTCATSRRSATGRSI